MTTLQAFLIGAGGILIPSVIVFAIFMWRAPERDDLGYGEIAMTDEQIKHMVDRFLGWKLPENFNPDAGISFKKTFNDHTAHQMKHAPTGTNLFDAEQADAMVRYMVSGMPMQTPL